MARKKKTNKVPDYVQGLLTGSGTITTSSNNIVVFDPNTFAPMLRGEDGIVREIDYNRFFAVTGCTISYGYGSYEIPHIDAYTIKAFRKSDFANLIMLLTLWIDDETIKEKVRVCSEKFTKEKIKEHKKELKDNTFIVRPSKEEEPSIYSEEDFDKFILVLTLEIDDIDIRNKFEETHQYWKKSVKR